MEVISGPADVNNQVQDAVHYKLILLKLIVEVVKFLIMNLLPIMLTKMALLKTKLMRRVHKLQG